MIYCIFGVFQEHGPKIVSFPMLFSRPGRPSARPSARHGSQVINMICVPVCPGSQVNNMACVPVFSGSKLNQNDWISSISRFPTDQNDLFPNSCTTLSYHDWISI